MTTRVGEALLLRIHSKSSMPSLALLLTDVRHCTMCSAYLRHNPSPILQIDPGARILVAAQAPGSRAHEAMRLFFRHQRRSTQGLAGLVFRRILHPALHCNPSDGVVFSMNRGASFAPRMRTRMATTALGPPPECYLDGPHRPLCPGLSSVRCRGISHPNSSVMAVSLATHYPVPPPQSA